MFGLDMAWWPEIPEAARNSSCIRAVLGLAFGRLKGPK